MSTTTTTATEELPSQSVVLGDRETLKADFNYWGTTTDPQESELLAIFTGKSTGLRAVQCPVTDIRPIGLSSFNLGTHGFQVLKHSSALLPPQADSIPDFHDEKHINATYWPELVSMLKSQLGVRSAVAVGSTVRDIQENDPDEFDHKLPRRFLGKSLQPFFIVHGDYTPAGARAHFRAVVPTYFEELNNMEGTTERERKEFFQFRDEVIAAEEKAMKEEGVTDQWAWSGKNYAGPRWGYLSVWRALETVHRDPLGVMDPRSLFRPGVEKPYIGLQRDYRDRPGFEKPFKSENLLAVAPQRGDEHKWYYISQQTPEEVYALKLFDSDAQKEGSTVAPFGAHSAFSLPDQESEKVRRSVEVRVMVIW
ncbi:hypothetical protein H2200_006349 [Cladophialophora chaetospira]|uniref:GA4 desaturase n=1 Tax=Cladophialophora chaetospira TaxID=386627 RepID=A0AA39CJ09_9EURO|nr:hypothetical protein H2200_006349 [Cladophialophora chaetospira]